MLKNSKVLDAFSQLGKSQVVPASVTKSVSMYTCNLYGGRCMFRDVNHARHMLMSKKIPQNKAKQNLSKLKSFDPATLPPCLCVLEQKIARVNYVTHVWINAHKACINEWGPPQAWLVGGQDWKSCPSLVWRTVGSKQSISWRTWDGGWSEWWWQWCRKQWQWQ